MKPSDSALSASIHPLVLLTVSDQITRHQARNQNGPILGALLGQLHGRLVTAEHAFPCKVIENTEGQWLLDQEWMAGRIQQCEYITTRVESSVKLNALSQGCTQSPGP